MPLAGRKVRHCYGFARFRARSSSPLPLKVHPLDPRHLFRRHFGFEGAPWTLDDTILVAAKRLIISKMLIILGAKRNEDFQEVAE